MLCAGCCDPRSFCVQTAMRELWVMRYDHWALPISVEWIDQQDMAAIRIGSGLCLLDCQRNAVEVVLRKIGERRNNRWWVMRGDLNRYAVKIDHGNPEECVEWKPTQTRKFKVRETPDQDEFIQDFCRSTVFFKTPGEAKAVWFAFCKHSLHWMLNRQRSVNMLFCELVPVPYRPNWKQIVMQMDFRIKRINPREQTITKMIDRGVLDLMLDNHMIMWDKVNRQIYWSIDVRHTAMWYRMVHAVEAHRKKIRRNIRGYIADIVDAMKRGLPNALRSYYSHIREITRPYVILQFKLNRKSRYFSKHDRSGKAAEETMEPHGNPVSIDPGDASVESCTTLGREAEVEFLSRVSDLRQGTGDMRDTVGQGEVGVSVPDEMGVEGET